jgi:hypothetical protein
MTIDEQRQAWRAYLTASLSAFDNRDYAMDAMAVVANFLLKTERKRFDAPDHSADADKMVERPWMGLTAGDIDGIVRYWQSDPPCAYAELVALVEGCLREKNGGTR